ncbi:putative ABC transporter permease [Extibacter sp. GGCC_0201]|uniref:putative ABC transporter permease n=1 Tax=Extibacter sp. GGCC_0201 TaxID=2731209 RepID=UPI001AA0FB9C|nr:hypothetical protein [Extibacter sp. GGCC_0201]MBO1719093.1 hypothetical protein [Extibacter sp. GGCC_0201]
MKHNFLSCGTAGWCMEILFTGLHSYKEKNPTLMGSTSIWMFPIYGMASFLSPVCKVLKGKSPVLRGGVYTCCIFIGEYITGSVLRRIDACPWDYSKAPMNINGLVRLDYAPFWFGAGLLFEKILSRS